MPKMNNQKKETKAKAETKAKMEAAIASTSAPTANPPSDSTLEPKKLILKLKINKEVQTKKVTSETSEPTVEAKKPNFKLVVTKPADATTATSQASALTVVGASDPTLESVSNSCTNTKSVLDRTSATTTRTWAIV